MPTKNPRISVVLTPSVAATLSQMAQETGDSAASIVRNILEQSHPALVRMLNLVRAAKEAQGQIGGGVAASLGRVVDDLEDALVLAEFRASRVIRDLVVEAEAVRPRRRRHTTGRGAAGVVAAPAAGVTPGPVTRGSGVGKTRTKGAKRG